MKASIPSWMPARRAALATLLVMSAPLALAACSDGDDAGSYASDAKEGRRDTPVADAGADGRTVADAAGAPRTEVIAAFDMRRFEPPEGLAIRNGVAYVGLVAQGRIVAVDLATKERSDHAAVPPLPPSGPGPGGSGALMTGLESASDGTLYAAVASFVPEAYATGIYRTTRAGEQATLFARSADFRFPNGIVVESDALYVTDSLAGAIFRVDRRDGATTKWLEDPRLASRPGTCPELPADAFQPGANGLSAIAGAFYVTNSSQGLVLRVARGANGDPGAIDTIASGCAELAGADGTAVDASGKLWVAVNNQNRIVRIDPETRVVTRVLEGEPLSSPASLAFAGPRLHVTNAAFEKFTDPENARPSLLAIDP